MERQRRAAPSKHTLPACPKRLARSTYPPQPATPPESLSGNLSLGLCCTAPPIRQPMAARPRGRVCKHQRLIPLQISRSIHRGPLRTRRGLRQMQGHSDHNARPQCKTTCKATCKTTMQGPTTKVPNEQAANTMRKPKVERASCKHDRNDHDATINVI